MPKFEINIQIFFYVFISITYIYQWKWANSILSFHEYGKGNKLYMSLKFYTLSGVPIFKFLDFDSTCTNQKTN